MLHGLRCGHTMATPPSLNSPVGLVDSASGAEFQLGYLTHGTTKRYSRPI